MRAAYYLALAVFFMGSVSMPTIALNAPHAAEPSLPADQQHASLDAARNDLPAAPGKSGSHPDALLASHFSRGALIGEALPEEIDLHPIPRHETYRYAVVSDHRVIVDAASRRVVYVVR
ncbi:DUF1236 domain-containing protein [Microvirga arabica]|uniref:DUF1236 domain-containing protein n=1 Tax=Microvirga arabica TaxID=1128671 RepID=A0ABV6YGW2_9HYPH